MKKPAVKPKSIKSIKFVKVSSRSYGHSLKGIKIFYEGARPKALRDDGSIKFGKNILELLEKSFKRFHWIIAKKKDEIKQVNGVYNVRTSQKTLSSMNSLSFARTRDIKIDIIKETFSRVYPSKHFNFAVQSDFRPGCLSEILKPGIISKLSQPDKEALDNFLPEYISRESVSAVNFLKATTQIRTLKELAKEIRDEIGRDRSEGWWQKFIQKNILFIQQGYINAIPKMNISIGNIKFPDFSLVTHDDFLDIFEIKKPSTTLLKYDDGRENYFWDSEISKAIIQVENYIENVSKNAESVRGYIKDKFRIDLKVVRPRGIILVGNSTKLTDQKQKDDFRLLTLASKNISFITYDELAKRLENYINVLEKHSKKNKK